MSPLREYLCVKCGADDLFVGVETISHLREPGNGRITIMLNAFEGPPQIVRLFGKGNPPPFPRHPLLIIEIEAPYTNSVRLNTKP